MAKNREDKVKTLRILEIDRIIREGSYPNTTDLGKKFEVSRSTIMRDLEFLRDRYRAPLEYDFQKGGFYYTDPTFFIGSVMLTEKELFTASIILPLMDQYKNTPLESSFRDMFKKITSMLPTQISVDSAFASKEIRFISDPLPSIQDDVFNTIFKALKTHITVKFMYRSLKRHDFVSHTFNPYHVLCQKGNWYVIGKLLNPEEIRIFSLARMKEIKCLKNQFSIPKDFDIKNFIDPSFGIWNSNSMASRIELLFSPQIRTYILERNWHETQELQEYDDGSVYLAYTTNQTEETFHWIMHFGSEVKVLNPPELAERVRQEASKIAEMYR